MRLKSDSGIPSRLCFYIFIPCCIRQYDNNTLVYCYTMPIWHKQRYCPQIPRRGMRKYHILPPENEAWNLQMQVLYISRLGLITHENNHLPDIWPLMLPLGLIMQNERDYVWHDKSIPRLLILYLDWAVLLLSAYLNTMWSVDADICVSEIGHH